MAKIRVGNGYTSRTALYNGIKDTFTRHGGWTNTLDTFTSDLVWVLEYLSTLTIDGDPIKIRITSTSTTTITTGIYDKTNTLRTAVNTTGTTSTVVKESFLVADDYCVYIQGTDGGSTSGYFLLGNVLKNTSLCVMPGADSLCAGTYVSAYPSLVFGRCLNTSGTIVTTASTSYSYLFDLMVGYSTNSLNYNQVTNGNVNLTLIPVQVGAWQRFGYKGELKNSFKFCIYGAPIPGVNISFLVQGVTYRVIKTMFNDSYSGTLLTQWEEIG